MTEPIDEEQWARSLAASPERRSVTVETPEERHARLLRHPERFGAPGCTCDLLPHDATEPAGPLDVERLAEALTMYAQIGDWLHGGITIEGAREVAQKLVAEYTRLSPGAPREDESDEPTHQDDDGNPAPPGHREAGAPREDERLREEVRPLLDYLIGFPDDPEPSR